MKIFIIILLLFNFSYSTTWQDVGIHYASSVAEWKKINIKTPEEAKKWQDVGIQYTSDVTEWKKINIKTPEEAKKWQDVGIRYASSVAEWQKINIKTPEEAKKWRDVGIRYLEDVTAWKKINIKTPEEAKKWCDVEISSASDVTAWKKINIKTPEEAKKWKDVGIKNTNVILYLMRLNIKTVEEYKPYSGMDKLRDIGILKSLNIKPDDLIESMSRYSLGFESKEKFLTSYKILKRNHCKKLEGTFNYVDEYDNEGKCYNFIAKMYQRLDRTNGLAFNIDYRRQGSFFYVIFNKSWKETQVQDGVIKGLGNYKYQTYGGGMNNIAKGKVILFK